MTDSATPDNTPVSPTIQRWLPQWAVPLAFAFVTRAQPMVYGAVFLLLAIKKTPIVEYGYYAALLSGYFLILILRTTLYYPLLRLRTKPERTPGAEPAALITASIVAIIASLIAIPILWFGVQGTEWAGIAKLVWLLPLFAITSVVREFFVILLVGDRRTGGTAITESTFYILMLFGLLLFDPLGIPWTASSLLINWITFSCVSTVAGWMATRKSITWDWKDFRHGQRELLKIGRYIGPATALNIAIWQADTMLFSLFTTPAQIGRYAAVRMLLRAFEGVSSAFVMILLPTVSRFWEAGRVKLIRTRTLQGLTMYAVGAVTLSTTLIALVDWWGPLVYGARFTDAAHPILPIMIPMLLLATFEGTHTISQNVLFGCGGERMMFRRSIPLLVIFLVTAWIAVTKFGALGGIGTLAMGHVVGTFLFGFALWKRWNTHPAPTD